MKISDLFSGKQKKVILYSGGVLAISIFALMITGFVWYSRLSPYFKYAIDTGFKVYKLTLCFSVFELISLIYIIIDIIFFIPLKKVMSKFFNNTCKILTNLIVFLVIKFIGLILAIATSTYALNHDLAGKCWLYVGYLSYGIYQNHLTMFYDYDFMKWYENYSKHVTMDYDTGLYFLDSYYCDSVGLPTLIFAIIELVGCLALAFGIYMACKHPADDESIAEDENAGNIEDNETKEDIIETKENKSNSENIEPLKGSMDEDYKIEPEIGTIINRGPIVNKDEISQSSNDAGDEPENNLNADFQENITKKPEFKEEESSGE